MSYRSGLVFSAGIVACFVLGSGSAAQSRYTLDSPDPLSSLSTSSVTAIAQDHSGYLWFGTTDGLNRYDGTFVRVYRHSETDSTSLSNSNVRSLAVDSRGRLWIGTHHGVNRFDESAGSFTRLPAESSCAQGVNAIAEDNLGTIWFGTDNGVCILRVGSHAAVPFAASNVTERVHQIIPREDGPVIINGSRACTTASGSCTDSAAHLQDGMFAILGNDGQRFSLSSSGTHGVVIRRELPVGVHQVTRFEPMEFVQKTQQTAVMATLGGTERIVVATEQAGIVVFEPASGRMDAVRPGELKSTLCSDAVQSLFVDKQGNVWIGSRAGICRMRTTDSTFELYRARDPEEEPLQTDTDDLFLSDSRINGMGTDRSGFTWVGTNDGLNRFDPKQRTFRKFRRKVPPSPDYPNAFWQVYEDRQGRLLVGSKRSGLFVFDRVTGQFARDPAFQKVRIRDQPGDHLPIRHISEDGDGGLWIGTSYGLALRHAGTDTFSVYNPASLEAPPFRVNTVLHDRNQTWIGTDRGICSFVRSTRTLRCFYESGSGNMQAVWSIVADRSDPDMLWIGSVGDGLCAFRKSDGSATCFTRRDGLPGNRIYGVIRSDLSTLWLSTDAGIAEFNTETHAVRTFDADDGLQGNEFDLMATYRDPAGWIYFGGMNGLNRFHPDSLGRSPFRPRVVISEVASQNSVIAGVASDDTLIVGDSDAFSIRFAALDYASPKKNHYRYRLAGYESNARLATGEDPVARYSEVPVGRYVFEVYGSNADGVFSDAPARLYVVVPPALWQSDRFRFLAVLMLMIVVVGAVGLSYRRRVQRMELREAEQRQLQKALADGRERERRRIARDLHDGPVQRLYRLGHELDQLHASVSAVEHPREGTVVSLGGDAASVAIDEVRDALEIERIRSEIGIVASELRDTLTALRPSIVEHLGSIAAVRSLGRRFEKRNPHIALRYTMDADDRQWHDEIGFALYRITQEALNNIDKHSGARNVTLDLRSDGRDVLLQIQDDGCGFFLPDKLLEFTRTHHFGLIGVKEQVESVGGTLRIDTKPGRGTSINARIPLKTMP